MLNITDKTVTKGNAKWGLAGIIINTESFAMTEFIPMTEYLTPGVGGKDLSKPKVFDTREEVIEWMEDLKKEFSSIVPMGKDAIISIKSKYAKYPVGSAFFGMEVMKRIEVSDTEDSGIKVKCTHPDDSISYYLFKPCTIEDDGWNLF